VICLIIDHNMDIVLQFFTVNNPTEIIMCKNTINDNTILYKLMLSLYNYYTLLLIKAFIVFEYRLH